MSSDSYLHRVVRVLSAFRPEDDVLGPSELARRTGLPKSTVHRIMHALADEGLLERSGQEARLGLRLFEIGQRVPRRRVLRDAALPYMADLWEATRQTIHLAVLEGTEVVDVEILHAPGGPDVPSRVGGRLPAHATGAGKAILAFSPPEVVQRVLENGLPRVSGRAVAAPATLLRELARIPGGRASPATGRSRRRGSCARPRRCWGGTARCWGRCRRPAGRPGRGWSGSRPRCTPRPSRSPARSAAATARTTRRSGRSPPGTCPAWPRVRPTCRDGGRQATGARSGSGSAGSASAEAGSANGANRAPSRATGRDHAVVDPGAAPLAVDQPGGAQHLQVVGDGRRGQVEGGGQVAHAGLATGMRADHRQQAQPYRVGDGLEQHRQSAASACDSGALAIGAQHRSTVVAMTAPVRDSAGIISVGRAVRRFRFPRPGRLMIGSSQKGPDPARRGGPRAHR